LVKGVITVKRLDGANVTDPYVFVNGELKDDLTYLWINAWIYGGQPGGQIMLGTVSGTQLQGNVEELTFPDETHAVIKGQGAVGSVAVRYEIDIDADKTVTWKSTDAHGANVYSNSEPYETGHNGVLIAPRAGVLWGNE
jgi:hypothetical protein